MEKYNNISPFKVWWIFLVPIEGKATTKDLNIIKNDFVKMSIPNALVRHCPNKDFAKNIIKNIKAPSKKYSAILINDFQLGKMQGDVFNVATEKQKAEAIVIGE